MSNMSEFSISCWAKPTSSNLNNSLFLVRRDGSHQIRLSSDGFCFRDNHHSSQTVVSFGEPFLENIWTHISCVYKKGIIYLYQNGIQTNSANYYHEDSQTNSSNTEIRIGRQQFSSGNNYFTGYINDFRIYDHALSPMEVKQISQGLILHYLLNAKNLFNYHATTYAKSFDSNGNTKNTSGWAISDYISIFPNQSYLGIGLSTGGSNTYAVLYDINKNKTRTILEVANQNLIVNSNQNEYYIRLSIRDLNHELTTTAKFLENNNIQYDTSGYNHNLKNFNKSSFSNDTPKYNVSTELVGASYGTHQYLFLNDNYQKELTVSCWVKRTSSENVARYISNSWIVLYLHSDFAPRISWRNSTGTSDRLNTWAPGGIIPINTWTHICFTIKDGIVRYYKNGTYISTSDRTQYGTLIHGSLSNGFGGESLTSKNWIGGLSDFRFYCTALSVKDILSLYNNSAYIDNQGNIYGAIYEEV